jgi:hypothetical protein
MLDVQLSLQAPAHVGRCAASADRTRVAWTVSFVLLARLSLSLSGGTCLGRLAFIMIFSSFLVLAALAGNRHYLARSESHAVTESRNIPAWLRNRRKTLPCSVAICQAQAPCRSNVLNIPSPALTCIKSVPSRDQKSWNGQPYIEAVLQQQGKMESSWSGGCAASVVLLYPI